MRKRLCIVALLTILVMLISACGATTPAPGGQAPGGQAPGGQVSSESPSGQPADSEPTPAVSGDPVKLGVVLTLSGPAAPVGTTVMRGLEIALEEVNTAGGIAGRPVELVVRDDQGDPAGAAAAVTRVVERDGVAAIIGAAITVTTFAAAEVANESQVVMLSPTFTGDTLTFPVTDSNRYIFRIGVPDRYSVQVLADYAATHFDKIGIMSVAGPAGQSVVAIGARELEARGKPPVGEEFYNMGATDMTPQLLKLKEAGTQALIVQAVPGDTPTVVRGMRQIGFEAQLLGHLGFADAAFRVVAGSDADGAMIVDAYDPDNPRTQEFMAKFQSRFGNDPIYHGAALQGYDSLHILVEALNRVGGDVDRLVESLESLTGFQGASGSADSTINFSAQMHDGLELNSVVLHRVQDGVLHKVQVGLGH